MVMAKNRKKQNSLFSYDVIEVEQPVNNTPEPKLVMPKNEETIEQIFGIKPVGVKEQIQTKKATHWWGQSNKSKR